MFRYSLSERICFPLNLNTNITLHLKQEFLLYALALTTCSTNNIFIQVSKHISKRPRHVTPYPK